MTSTFAVDEAIRTLNGHGIDVRALADTVAQQGAEIHQLRTELASADERAQGPAERCTAAIQLAEARYAIIKTGETSGDLVDVDWSTLYTAEAAAINLWETVR